MDSEHADGRYAPTQVRIEDIRPQRDGLTLATRKRRFCAIFVDGLAVMAISALLAKFFPFFQVKAMVGLWAIVDFKPILANFLLLALLNGYLLWTRGQSIGKFLLKIRIAKPSGERVSASSLCIRYGAGLVFAITSATSLLYCLVDSSLGLRPSRRCLHDMLANTVVLEV
ncbi:MAG: hypothetical protein JWP29_3451 [Rhodoferax sp.]|nr:hypothetical protein [Rhodoferax sp.]